ncbi:MAG TPA: hypothetical protein VEF04_03145, partial [Blastocatellia bacterium]|nr:hypothetical protein [Blastocatellia bacterium]
MMTLTLTMILPALLGATLGRAALKRLALMDQNKFEEYTETWNSRLAKWLQVFLILPFALYSFSYALILVIFSLSVAIISILAFAPLILLSPGLLCFLIPAGIIVLIVALTKWRLISFSIPPTFRQRTLVIISIA